MFHCICCGKEIEKANIGYEYFMCEDCHYEYCMMENISDYIISKDKVSCLVCNKQTNYIEIYSERGICSYDCQIAWDNKYKEYISNLNDVINTK